MIKPLRLLFRESRANVLSRRPLRPCSGPDFTSVRLSVLSPETLGDPVQVLRLLLTSIFGNRCAGRVERIDDQ